MSKKQARKQAYNQIFELDRNHQEVFDEMKSTSGLEVTHLATILSGIPSATKRRNNKTLSIVLMLCCTVFILIRLFKFWLFFSVSGIEMKSLIIYSCMGLILPSIAIFAALRWKIEPLTAVALLFVFAIIGTIAEDGIRLYDPFQLIDLILQTAIVVLTFRLLFRTRTAFKVTESIFERDGKAVFRQAVEFDKEVKQENFNLLDL